MPQSHISNKEKHKQIIGEVNPGKKKKRLDTKEFFRASLKKSNIGHLFGSSVLKQCNLREKKIEGLRFLHRWLNKYKPGNKDKKQPTDKTDKLECHF